MCSRKVSNPCTSIFGRLFFSYNSCNLSLLVCTIFSFTLLCILSDKLHFGLDILESPAGYTHQTQSGVLQGQEIRAVGASERGTSAQPILPHWNLQPNPGQGLMQSSITGNQNHQPSEIRHPLSLSPGSSVSLPDENTPNFELDNFYRAILASKGNCVEASGNLPVPNANFISPTSQEYWRASEKGNGKEVGQTQPNASGKFMLFGANLSESPSKLLSPQTVVSTEHTRLSSVPPAISQPRFSEAIHVSDPSMGDYRNLPENQWKNYWSSTNRTCTKVGHLAIVRNEFH